jgi:glucosylglycerate synthase
LPEESFLTDDLLRQLMSVGEVDLIVGIPSHDHAETIGRTVEAIEESFQHEFRRERVVIINVDAGSQDGTAEAFLKACLHKNSNSRGLTSLRTEHRVVAHCGSPSPGPALRTIVTAADLLRAKACAVVSPGTPNLDPEWIGKLLRPAYQQNCDFIAPLYSRQRYDGLLARVLLYPMTRAIFGRRIRELHSTEFGFSGRLASICASQDVWHEAAVQDLPETWMAITAISSGLSCCQSYLGPKLRSLAGTTDIVTVVRQAVGALFWCVDSCQPDWIDQTGSEAVPTFGPDHALSEERSQVNLERIFELFQSGVAELSPILDSILSAEANEEIQRVATQDARTFHFDNALWTKTLYDFASSYHHTVLNRDHLIQALVPLYRGKIYSYLLQHENSSADEIEADSENLCLEFERQKPYLIQRWKVRSEVKL